MIRIGGERGSNLHYKGLAGDKLVMARPENHSQASFVAAKGPLFRNICQDCA